MMSPYIAVGLPKIIFLKLTKLTLSKILKSASEYFKIKESKLVSKTRKREIVECRMMIMYYMYEKGKFTNETIGVKFNRDHSTVVHARQVIVELFNQQERLKDLYDGFVDFVEAKK